MDVAFTVVPLLCALGFPLSYLNDMRHQEQIENRLADQAMKVDQRFVTAETGANAAVNDAIEQVRFCAANRTYLVDDLWRRDVWIPCEQQGENMVRSTAADLADFQHRTGPLKMDIVHLYELSNKAS